VVATVVAGVTFFIPDGYEPRAFENGMTIASNHADIVQMDPVGLRKR
jgi:hypothetical protein